MALLERVSTLLRANLNDLLDKSEDPEKLSKQIVLDMENQLLQVKTQVAVAVAEQHRLERQQGEHADTEAEWRRKAELAVSKGQDELARAALERSLTHGRLAAGFARQGEEQVGEAGALRRAYAELEMKLAETKTAIALLLSQHRRSRAMARTGEGDAMVAAGRVRQQMRRLETVVATGEAQAERGRVTRAIAAEATLEERFQTMEQTDRIEELLNEMKQARLQLGR